MDLINDLRIAMTLVSFITFVAIVWFAYSRHSRSRFDEAAQLPFMDDERAQPDTFAPHSRSPR